MKATLSNNMGGQRNQALEPAFGRINTSSESWPAWVSVRTVDILHITFSPDIIPNSLPPACELLTALTVCHLRAADSSGSVPST